MPWTFLSHQHQVIGTSLPCQRLLERSLTVMLLTFVLSQRDPEVARRALQQTHQDVEEDALLTVSRNFLPRFFSICFVWVWLRKSLENAKADRSGWGGGCPANGFWKVPWLTLNICSFFQHAQGGHLGTLKFTYISGEGGWGGCHAQRLPENVFINSWHLLCVSIIITIDRFYIALFSALKQTHHALVTWFRMSDFLWDVLNSHWSSVLTALFGCCLADAMWYCAVSEHILWTSHNNAPVYNVTTFKTTYAGCMCV